MDLSKVKNRLKFRVRNKTSEHDPYRDHDQLLLESKKYPSRAPKPQASSFSAWVFNLAHPKYRDARNYRALMMGKEGERRIEYHKLWAQHTRLPKPGNNRIPGWSLLFSDPLDGSASPFKASALTVGGQPLMCLPDVVFKNKETSELLIIERKITKSEVIPDAGWPNAKAQLWCYSRIDEFQSAPSIYLSTQIWRFHDGEYHLSTKAPRWEKGEEPFSSQQCELFELFGGQCVR